MVRAMGVRMKKRKVGRPAPTVPWCSFQARLPLPLNEALERALLASRRTKAEEIRMALEAWLSQLGFWPPDNGKNGQDHPV